MVDKKVSKDRYISWGLIDRTLTEPMPYETASVTVHKKDNGDQKPVKQVTKGKTKVEQMR